MSETGAALLPVDPATGVPLEPVPVTSSAGVAEAIAAARAAQPAWADTAFERRAEALRAFAARLVAPAQLEAIAALISREMGKPLGEARSELASVAPRLEDFITQARAAVASDHAGNDAVDIEVQWRPVGVVGVIAPWNYPVSTPHNLVASALLTGNAVVFKPSEITPRTGAAYAALLAEQLPPGLLGVVQGAGDVGGALVEGPVDMIAFTGSVPTGRRIMRAAAKDMKRLVLELGGKDPMIVLEGADLKAAAAHAVRESLRNAGQVCVAVERVFVQRSIEAEFLEAACAALAEVRVGDPADPATTMGPMSSERQRAVVLEQLADARTRGATFVVEGRPRGPGFFLEPSLVSAVSDDMALAREETFGPVVAVSSFEDADEALRRANATPYGLGASVWGAPGPELDRVVEGIEAGMVGVNRGLSAAGGAPWAGWKLSGFGHSRSQSGMRSFMLPRSVARSR